MDTIVTAFVVLIPVAGVLLLLTSGNPSVQELRPRGVLGWLISLVAYAALALFSVALIYIIRPVGAHSLGDIGFFATLFALQLMVVAVVAAILAFLSWKFISRLAGSLFGLTALVVGYIPVKDTTADMARASKYAVPVSLLKALKPQIKLLSGPELTKTVRYGSVDGEDLLLDVWPAKKVEPGKPHPTVIRIHGGGWTSGSRGDFGGWPLWLSELGVTVFDIDYRMPPPERWKSEVGDVKCAIGWVYNNADKHGIDRDAISVMGYSAGGHLAALAAITMGNPELPPTCDVPEVKVSSIINLYGPSDLPLFYQTANTPEYVQGAMKQWIGGSLEQYPERYKLLSPNTHINARTSPMIMFLGETDRIVPRSMAEGWDKALTAAGVYHEIYFLPSADHGYDANWTSLASQVTQTKVRTFLETYGGLKK